MRRTRERIGWLWLMGVLCVASGCAGGGDGTGAVAGPSGGCGVSLTRSTVSVPAVSGTTRVTVSTRSRCGWTGVSNASWLTVTPDSGGTGSGGLGFTFESNPTLAARTGTITVNDQTLTVTQEAPTLAGTWVATGPEALRSAAFTVRSGLVTRVRLTYLFPLQGGRMCARAYTQDMAVPITDGRFRLDFQASGVTTTLVVGFESAFVASAVIDRQTFSNASCGAGPSYSGTFGGIAVVFRPSDES